MRTCWICGKQISPDMLLCEDCIRKINIQTINKYKRMSKVLNILENDGIATARQISRKLAIKHETVLKYLAEFEKRGLVKRKWILKSGDILWERSGRR